MIIVTTVILVLCFCCTITIAAVILYNNSLNKPPSTSGFELVLERGPCFGFCPAYNMTLKENGDVKFVDSSRLNNLGTKEYRIDSVKVEQLISEINKINFFAYNDSYVDDKITDLPSTLIKVTLSGKTKQISMYGLSDTVPAELEALAKKIDQLTGVEDLLKKAEDDSNNQSNTDIIEVKTGKSFGFCIGYCQHELVLTSKEAIYTKVGQRDPDKYPTESKEYAMTKEAWDSLVSLLDQETFFGLKETLGCPDCADGGAEWIEITTKSRSYIVTFGYNSEVPEIKSFLAELRALREKFEF